MIEMEPFQTNVKWQLEEHYKGCQMKAFLDRCLMSQEYKNVGVLKPPSIKLITWMSFIRVRSVWVHYQLYFRTFQSVRGQKMNWAGDHLLFWMCRAKNSKPLATLLFSAEYPAVVHKESWAFVTAFILSLWPGSEDVSLSHVQLPTQSVVSSTKAMHVSIDFDTDCSAIPVLYTIHQKEYKANAVRSAQERICSDGWSLYYTRVRTISSPNIIEDHSVIHPSMF